MNRYLKVENEQFLVRDTASKAILNTDLSAVKKHDLRMQKEREELVRQKEINNLKKDIAEIRELLLKFMADRQG